MRWRGKEVKREKERQTDSQIDRQTEMKGDIDRLPDRQIDTQTQR